MTPLDAFGNAALLRAAALLLKSRQPNSQAILMFRTRREFGPFEYLVQFNFPGVVSVYLHETGELIVRSRPGRPATPEGAVRNKHRRKRPL